MRRLLPVLAWLGLAIPGFALAAVEPADPTPTTQAPSDIHSGREIYASFRAGLADHDCDSDAGSARWRRHFAGAPQRLAAPDGEMLALFGYVVDALRAASLPTEYALIPFVESGYRPGARSPGGPAGLWQMIALTARGHRVPMRAGYDGRLSPIDSTTAAVRYLRTLHGMFAGDWRLAVMAYNAGEYRVFASLKRSGQVARDADPDKLVGLSGITTAYVRKLHALSCLFDQADDRPQWMASLDRPVPVLDAMTLPPGTRSLEQWARAHDRDPDRVRRLNPAFASGLVSPAARAQQVLVASGTWPRPPLPALHASPSPDSALEVGSANAGDAEVADANARAVPAPREHVVQRGDSAWTIARRHGLTLAQLLARNGLARHSRLQPGMVLKLDAVAGE